MADDKKNKSLSSQNKTNRQISGTLNGLLDRLNTTVFGASKNDDVEKLNTRFQNLLNGEVNSLNRSEGGDGVSFISRLFNDQKSFATQDKEFIGYLNNMFYSDTNLTTIKSFMDEAYRNKFLKMADIHELSCQLIELREAILVTRDAIISSDIVEGKMSRIIKFDECGEDGNADILPVVEAMEEKFNLQDKIKNFIVPKVLEYGKYHIYHIPYSRIFGDFMKMKESLIRKNGGVQFNSSTIYGESTVYERTQGSGGYVDFKETIDSYVKEATEFYREKEKTTYNDLTDKSSQKQYTEEMEDYISTLLNRVTVCNTNRPLNILEEGIESIDFYVENYINPVTFNEKTINVDNIGTDSFFNQVLKPDKNTGEYIYNIPGSKNNKDNSEKIEKDFSSLVNDCYVKTISPLNLIPVKIMKKVIGYFYHYGEEVAPINMSMSLFSEKMEDPRKNRQLIGVLVERIVRSFDKKFLQDNIKFKDVIIEALNYYNLNCQQVRFQFIPAEYITTFVVSEDEDGEGTSIIEPSLFYAKLYSMLLLFKMMSIFLYSNDTRINYIRNSGIDKNVRKKVEEIARIKQQRQINVMDMFSYTTLINKIGIGAETYMPTGKQNERGIETEILQGQDVQLNTDLMDMLKKAYILGTGVPDAIMNYMNEADFAKSLELANTRFLGRVVSYQFDINKGVTEMYRKILKYSTNMSENIINTIEFAFAPPKSQNNQIKADLIANFETLSNFISGLVLGTQAVDNPEHELFVKHLKKGLAEMYLPMIDFSEIEKVIEKAKLDAAEEDNKPKKEPESEGDEDFGM